MAGIYIHIPFCRKKCFYCDFYKTTAVEKKPLFLQSLRKEAHLQAGYLGRETVETIYFGGGTPTVLTIQELSEILEYLRLLFPVSDQAEITLEANPDDLSLLYLKDLRQLGFNRLSIGIQSFSDQDLKKMNRRHSSAQAFLSVYDAAEAGFNHVSIDLIYGLPGLTLQNWEKNLKRAFKLPFNHLSAYHLTYHEGTKFHEWLRSGSLRELPEEDSIAQFERLMDLSAEAGFEQYEISNFARDKAYSKHNSSYWSGSKYLGLGPSAHSYDGISRQWNMASLTGYIKALESGIPLFEREELTFTERINDYLITRIRTIRGISLRDMANQFGPDYTQKVQASAYSFLQSGHLTQNGDQIYLTRKGIMVSDEIMLALVIAY